MTGWRTELTAIATAAAAAQMGSPDGSVLIALLMIGAPHSPQNKASCGEVASHLAHVDMGSSPTRSSLPPHSLTREDTSREQVRSSAPLVAPRSRLSLSWVQCLAENGLVVVVHHSIAKAARYLHGGREDPEELLEARRTELRLDRCRCPPCT